jgi:glycosyltransferase involved in cell wall biosynthesis
MEKILIVSSDDYILYQPTILNLYDFLKNDFDITIVSFEPSYLGKKRDENRNVIYLSCPEGKRKIFRFTDLCINAVLKRIDKYVLRFPYRSELVRCLKCSTLITGCKQLAPKHVIAVDIMPLFAAQQLFSKSHFLSLEILKFDSYLRRVDQARIQSVIIQNRDRFEFLFKNLDIPTFFIQNAPFCKDIYISSKERSALVWAGSIVKEFSVFSCLDFIRCYPQFNLVMKGAASASTRKELMEKYKDLLNSGKAIINEDYFSAQEFIRYLSKFRIGFCFYSWDLIKNNFNYQTAPSGKLFMYLAAGVPVIACNIPGFKFLEEFKAGILIDDYEPATIYKALQLLEDDYENFSKNCYEAAKYFCFEKNAALFKTYLDKTGNSA